MEPGTESARGEELARALPSALADHADAVGRVVISLLVGLELQRAHDEELDAKAYRRVVGSMLGCLERRPPGPAS